MLRQMKALGMLIALALSTAASTIPTYADQGPLYDWTVSIRTQHLERQFKYAGSKISDKVDRLDADIYDRDNEKNARPYESLWYFEGKPLGLELFNRFFVERAHGVCIRITHKTATPAESELRAAANAILRVWVDAQINQSASFIVKVPSNSFYTIISYLQNMGMERGAELPPEQLATTPMTLLVQSELPGQEQRLTYR